MSGGYIEGHDFEGVPIRLSPGEVLANSDGSFTRIGSAATKDEAIVVLSDEQARSAVLGAFTDHPEHAVEALLDIFRQYDVLAANLALNNNQLAEAVAELETLHAKFAAINEARKRWDHTKWSSDAEFAVYMKCAEEIDDILIPSAPEES